MLILENKYFKQSWKDSIRQARPFQAKYCIMGIGINMAEIQRFQWEFKTGNC